MKVIEIRNNSNGSCEVWVDDTNPGGRARFVNGIDPVNDNVERTRAMVRGLAIMLGVAIIER